MHAAPGPGARDHGPDQQHHGESRAGPATTDASTSPAGPAGPPGPLLPVWAGAVGAATLALVAILLVPDVRAWFLRRVAYPVAARVLGRDSIVVSGVRIEAAPEPGLTAALAILVVLLALALRAYFATRSDARWSRHVQLDTPFMLALVPYLALAPLLAALADMQLFTVPWAFLAVPPTVILLVVAFITVSLTFAIWIETGGRTKGPPRLIISVLLFLVVGLFWMVALHGTTTPLRWWIALAAALLIVVVHYSVTLGNRIHSHRRALFSLGCFHLAFFGGFLLLWFLEGPWPMQEWSFAGQGTVRDLEPHTDRGLLFALAIGPAMLIAVGAYTIGAFLHRYAVWTRAWVDGLSILVVFAQTLEAWTVTLMVNDPYDALDHTTAAPGPLSAWSLGLLHGWGYLMLKLAAAVALVLLFSMPHRMAQGRWLEIRTIVLGIVAGAGLVAGLRYTLTLVVGV